MTIWLETFLKERHYLKTSLLKPKSITGKGFAQ
jgi:hypothetical protein